MTDRHLLIIADDIARFSSAFEGSMPSGESFFGHVKKTLAGFRGFYMAGRWVEPGGGIPTAAMSGRQALQLACADEKRPFVATRREAAL